MKIWRLVFTQLLDSCDKINVCGIPCRNSMFYQQPMSYDTDMVNSASLQRENFRLLAKTKTETWSSMWPVIWISWTSYNSRKHFDSKTWCTARYSLNDRRNAWKLSEFILNYHIKYARDAFRFCKQSEIFYIDYFSGCMATSSHTNNMKLNKPQTRGGQKC